MTRMHEILNMNVPEEWKHNHAYNKGFTHGQIGISAAGVYTQPDYKLGYEHGSKVKRKRDLQRLILNSP